MDTKTWLLNKASQFAYRRQNKKAWFFALLLVIAFVATPSVVSAQNKLDTQNLVPISSPDDGVLYDEAAVAINRGDLVTARKCFSLLVEKYPDSTYLAFAKLGIADTFTQENLYYSLGEAAKVYEAWLTEFPEHPLVDQVMFKVAHLYMELNRRMRNMNYPFLARRKLKELLQRFPNTELRQEGKKALQACEEELADHNLRIAYFYLDLRQSIEAAQMRFLQITTEYVNYSKMDQVLSMLGKTYVDAGDWAAAMPYYQRLVCQFPQSPYSIAAIEQMKNFGVTRSTDCETWRTAEPGNPDF